MQPNDAIPDVVGEARDRLKSLYGHRLQEVILYGSHARGEAMAGSDIDLMVVLADFDDPEDEASRMDAVGAELSLQNDVVITFIPIRARDYSQRNTPLLVNVRREGISV